MEYRHSITISCLFEMYIKLWRAERTNRYNCYGHLKVEIFILSCALLLGVLCHVVGSVAKHTYRSTVDPPRIRQDQKLLQKIKIVHCNLLYSYIFTKSDWKHINDKNYEILKQLDTETKVTRPRDDCCMYSKRTSCLILTTSHSA